MVQRSEGALVDSFDPKTNEKPPKRCYECDRVMEHYNEWLLPTNEMRVVCWECTQRTDKGFNTRRGFRRSSRNGVIPR